MCISCTRDEGHEFKWVNTGLGNIKSTITGTCRSCSTRHADRYLTAYEYRFNRRFRRASMAERLAVAAMQTAPTPYRTITPDEVSG